MLAEDKMAAEFFGADPLKGDDARAYLIERYGVEAAKFLLSSKHASNSKIQVEARLKALAKALGPSIVTTLVETIEHGGWFTKGAASAMFAGLTPTNQTMMPLVSILERDSDFDAQRIAIEALGYLRAYGWSFKLEEFCQTGRWNGRPNLEEPNHYAFGKLASYVVEALARFSSFGPEYYSLSQLRRFMLFDKKHRPNVTPDAFYLVRRRAADFGPNTVDYFVDAWNEDHSEEWRGLTCEILAQMCSVRSAKFLLEIATSQAIELSVRTSASIALGNIQDIKVAQRVADCVRAGVSGIDKLDWAFSSLRRLSVDWSGTDEFAENILSRREDDEPACQLRYSFAPAGDLKVRNNLNDLLDSRFKLCEMDVGACA